MSQSQITITNSNNGDCIFVDPNSGNVTYSIGTSSGTSNPHIYNPPQIYPWTVQPNVSPAVISDNTFTFDPNTIEKKVDGSMDYATMELFEMLLKGKDFEKHKKEYMDIIMKLPWVNRNNLKALQTFKRFKKLAKLMEVMK